MPPESGRTTPPQVVDLMSPPVGIHHVRHQGLDIARGTLFRDRQVTVAHQRHRVASEDDDTVHYVVAAFDPRQHHIPDPQVMGFLKDDTLPTTDDERQHTVPVHWQRHAHALPHQSYRLLYDPIIGHLHLFTFSHLSTTTSCVLCAREWS